MTPNWIMKDLKTSLPCFWVFIFITIQANVVTAKIGYFWHITDLHFDSFYTTKGDVIRSCWHTEHHQGTSNRQPGRYGDYLCDSPWSLLESATQTMRSKQGDNVEFVLWTGDGLSHSAKRLLEPHRLDLLRNITELLGRTFPSQFVFPVLGHEDGQNGDFRRLGEQWRHWLPSEALQTFERGGYYTIEQTKSRLRIIALNTNFMRHDVKYSHMAAVRQRPGVQMDDTSDNNNFYYHHGNRNHGAGDSSGGSSGSSTSYHGTSYGQGGQVSALSGAESHESQKQWEWLEEVLAKSSKNKETVYIVGHIPPGSDERQVGSLPNGHTTFTEKNNLRYLRLVRKYASIIQGQFFGHLHSDSFRIIYNEIGRPVSWMMIAPSVTPRKANVGSNNPAMRLYKFETDTGQVLDYTQYYLDLSAANILSEAVWQAEYNLTSHYYSLSEVTAVALHNLADRFTNPEDVLFAKYYRANSVRYVTQPCDSVCSLHHYCAITRVDYREFRQCLETAASALSSLAVPLFYYKNNKNQLLLVLTSVLSLLYHYKNSLKLFQLLIKCLISIFILLPLFILKSTHLLYKNLLKTILNNKRIKKTNNNNNLYLSYPKKPIINYTKIYYIYFYYIINIHNNNNNNNNIISLNNNQNIIIIIIIKTTNTRNNMKIVLLNYNCQKYNNYLDRNNILFIYKKT